MASRRTVTAPGKRSTTGSPVKVLPLDAECFFRNYRDKLSNPDVDLARLTEKRFVAPFDINGMHSSQRSYFQSRNRLRNAIENPAVLADLLADLVSTSHTNGHLPLAARADEGVQMYRDALAEHGFRPHRFSEINGLTESEVADGFIAWFVVGCQGRALLRRRGIAAAHAVFAAAGPKIEQYVIFCGAHPPDDRVDQLNESAELRRAFDKELRALSDGNPKHKLNRDKIHLDSENQSTSTAENISNAFAKLLEHMTAGVTARPYLTGLVSNDFHLIRLSRDLRQFRRSGKLAHNGKEHDLRDLEASLNLSFRGLLLIGSEFFDLSETLSVIKSSPRFVKRFYFEVLSDFFRRNYFLGDTPHLLRASIATTDHRNDVVGLDAFTGAQTYPDLAKCDATRVELVAQLNRLVFEPVRHSDLKTAIEDRLLEEPKLDPPARTQLLIVNRLGGRFSQPTVRLVGDPRAVLLKDKGSVLVRLQLGRSFEGLALAAQYDAIQHLNESIRLAVAKHQLLPLTISVLYCFSRQDRRYVYLRRRAAHRYIFSETLEATLEGPVYLDDFGDGENLDLRRPILRLIRKEYLLSFKDANAASLLRLWAGRTKKAVEAWNDAFTVLGFSHDRRHGQSCIHGILEASELHHSAEPFRLVNSLDQEPTEVELTPKALHAFFKGNAKQGRAMLLPETYLTLLYALKRTSPEASEEFRTLFEKSFSTDVLAFGTAIGEGAP